MAGGPVAGAVVGGATGGEKAGQSGTGDDVLPMTSDERCKEDVTPIKDRDLLRLGEGLDLATFRYKNGIEDNGAEEHAGVESAQELEKDPLGKKFVINKPGEPKRVDIAPLAALLASALIREQRRKEAR